MLQVGERAPDFVLPVPDGTPARFYGRAGGRPTALILPGAAADPEKSADFAAAFHDRPELAALWIVGEGGAALLPAGVQAFIDADGAVADRLGAKEPEGAVVLLDSNLRVIAAGPFDVPAEQVLDLLSAAVTAAGRTVESQAPVLMVPRVVEPDLAAALMDQCRAESVLTGVESVAGAAALDPGRKRRRDVTVTDADQLRTLSAAVGKRVMPEVERAFAFRATRFEGFKIAWYDEEYGGFFAAHRDNLTPATAHRVFGLSINLNDGYEGGDLVFPEYGADRYRAPAGAAMIFSSSLLHGVRPVVRGSRFVLLSFLYS